MRIIPSPKKYTGTEAPISLGERLTVSLEGEVASRLGTAVRELLSVYSPELSSTGANVILRADYASDKAEAYTVSVADGCITARFSDFLGGRNALATIAQLLELHGGGIYAPEVEIEDYPDGSFRAFMHDVGRKYVPMDELRLHLLTMAKFKMNVLHFHFSEAVGFGIMLEGFPDLVGPGGMQYTEEDIKELVAYAEALGIDVIPEIDVPGHAYSITREYPGTACDCVSGEPSQGWAMCAGSDETYELLDRLIERCTHIFGSKYFHIGTDEISMTDLVRTPKPVADWMRCSRCLAVMEREGITDEVEMFYYFLRRVYAIVKKHGRRLMMWNDWIDISKSPDLPRDILIEFWRVAAPTRGPHIGCSMQRFLEEGFTVVNAHYPDTYIDLYVDYVRLRDWSYNRQPADDTNTPGKIIGGDVPAWDVHDHYCQSIPVSIALFGDKLWNSVTDWGEDFLPTVSKALLGDPDLCIFDYTREVVCLDDEHRIWRDDIDRASLTECLSAIHSIDPLHQYCRRTYLSLLALQPASGESSVVIEREPT